MKKQEININGEIKGVAHAEAGSTINQTINVFSLSEEEEDKLCKTSYSNLEDIYIKRDIDKQIEEKLNQNKSSVLFIHGRGGIGKSTLLKEIQNKANISSIRINITESTNIDMGEVLLDKSQTTIVNCPNFERKRNKLLNNRISDYELIKELRKDFSESGLFIVDTFEKYMDVNIYTKIHFSDKKFEENIEKNRRFKDYLQSLIYHFTSDSNMTFIIGGRTSLSDGYLSAVKDNITEFSVGVFTLENMRDYFDEFTKVNNFDMPSSGQLNSIEEITKGNPLLIHSFAHLSKTYSSWENVDFQEMKEKIEEDNQYGLLFYFTEKIASCTTLDNELWKLVVPRTLNDDIINVLFQEASILKSLIDAGLAFQKNKQYFLHDEVLLAITAHAKKEFKKNLLSWHDHKKVRSLHQELANFYKKDNSTMEEDNFESCYHRMMRKEGFDFSLDGFSTMKKEDFIRHFLGSLFIGYDEKIKICRNFEFLEKDIIEEKVRKVISELKEILPQMSSNLYERCLTDIGKGTLKNGIYDIDYLNKLLDGQEYKRELSLYKFLGQVYQGKKLYIKERDTYINALRLNIDKDEKDDYFYLLIGNTYFREENYDEALFNYKLSIKLNKKAETYNNMGVIYERQGEVERAIEYYKKSIEIKPLENTYIDLSMIYYEKENYIQSLYLLDKAIEMNSFNEVSFMYMANCFREKKEYCRSLHYYQLALKINSENEYIYNNLGILLENEGKYKDAIKWYKKAININFQNEWFYSNLANVYMHIKKYSKARDCYVNAIKINPNNATHYNSLGNIIFNQEHQIFYLSLGNNNKNDAIILYKKAIELEPKNTKFYINLANTYSKNKNYNKAIEMYEDLLIKKPKFYLVSIKLGDCYYKLKDYDTAIKKYLTVLEKININNRVGIYDKLMKCYFYHKNFKMILEVFKRKRHAIIYINKIHNDQLVKEMKLWFDDISINIEYFLIGVLGLGSIGAFTYLIFLIMT